MAIPDHLPPNLNTSAPCNGVNDIARLLDAANAPTALDAALGYHALGLTVIPKMRGKKVPGIDGWQHLRPTEDDLRLYYATGKYDGVSIRPGAISGNLAFIDTDDLLSYSAFGKKFPDKAETYTELSGGLAGRHLWFIVKRLPVLETTKLKRKIVVDGQETHIELFWDSGQVVVAPSMHPSGNHYTVEKAVPIVVLDDLDDVVEWIFSLKPEDERAAMPTEPTQPTVPTQPGTHCKYAESAIKGMSEDVKRLTSVKNDFQNDACFGGVFKGAHYVARGDATEQELYKAFHNAMDANGYIGAFGFTAFKKTFESGFRRGLADTSYVPRCYQAGFKAHKPKKSVRRRLEKEALRIGINDPAIPDDYAYAKEVAHVSDALTPDEIAVHPTLLVAGGTGLGKSTAIADYINGLKGDPYITAIAQFRLLTSALYNLLKDFSHYEQADGAHQRALGQVARLVTSLSSLAKFDRHGGRVVIDEITGVLKFLAESGTFKGGEALAAYRALVALLESAVQLVGMDANLDDITIRFVEKHRGRVTIKRYRRAQPRGKVTLLDNKIAAICMIEKLLAHRRGLVFAPCSSAETTTQITEHFTALGYRVLKITRDTSNTERVRKVAKDAALRAAFDLIAYDSAIGAGVDFSEQAYAQVAIFDNKPLAPEDAIQLFGRVRQAVRRYAAVPPDSEGYRTASADELMTDILKREEWTARRLKASPEIAGDMLELAQVWAQFKARQLRETARWRHHFIQRLQADDFTVVENNAHAPPAFAEAWKEWKANRDDQHFAYVLNDAEGKALPTDDLDRLRQWGVEITTEHNLRNRRWEIEQAKATEQVVEQDRDLMKYQGRRRLFHLRDWFSDEDDLHASDQAQRDEGRPIHKRRYDALAREVLVALFKLAGHTGTPEQQLMGFIDTFRQLVGAEDVTARYAALGTSEAFSKFKALGHYGNNAKTIPGLCRWLLEYFGLKLLSDRRRVEGVMTTRYLIDAETLNYRLDRARYAAEQRPVIGNVYSSLNIHFRSPLQAQKMPEDVTGWAAAPEEFAERMAWLRSPVGVLT